MSRTPCHGNTCLAVLVSAIVCCCSRYLYIVTKRVFSVEVWMSDSMSEFGQSSQTDPSDQGTDSTYQVLYYSETCLCGHLKIYGHLHNPDT